MPDLLLGSRWRLRSGIPCRRAVRVKRQPGRLGPVGSSMPSALWEASPVWPNPVAEPGTMPVAELLLGSSFVPLAGYYGGQVGQAGALPSRPNANRFGASGISEKRP
jgi:hypothetical protein